MRPPGSLARQEGLFLGMSSGAAVAVAIRKAREMEDGLIVVIAPDGGERYLSTSLFIEKEVPTLLLLQYPGPGQGGLRAPAPGRSHHLCRRPGPLRPTSPWAWPAAWWWPTSSTAT